MDDVAILIHEKNLWQAAGSKQQKTAACHMQHAARIRTVACSLSQLRMLASSLSRLLEGGIPILKSLEALEKSCHERSLKSFLQEIQEQIRQGKSFSQALDEKTGRVPPYFVQIVRAGEMAGAMPKVLEELSQYLEKEEALKQKVREALAYPAFILLMGMATLAVLIKFVIPKLATVYEDFGGRLPLLTQLLLQISRAFPLLLIAGVISAAFFGYLIMQHRPLISRILFHLPVAGKLFQSFVRVQFSRLVSLLLESGVTILETLEITAKTFAQSFIQQDLFRLKQDLAEGKGFKAGMAGIVWMDELSKMLIVSGEESGRLGQAFDQISRDTQSQMESQIQWMVKLIEPALILGVGLIVGIVVIATVLPIFDMGGLIK